MGGVRKPGASVDVNFCGFRGVGTFPLNTSTIAEQLYSASGTYVEVEM
jgi:hypothetical protein